MMQRRGGPSAAMAIAAILIIILAVVTVVGALTAFQLPYPITEQGKNTKLLFEATLIISFIVFFLVTSGIIYAIFRFKRKPGDPMPAQIHGSSVLEFAWTAIPVLILVGLFIPSLILVLDLKSQPAQADADVVINVIGHQWWWEFDYPNDSIKVQSQPPDYNNLVPPQLVVPEGKTVLLRVQSTDVIHSFYAPHLLYKIQAVPGSINEMHFKADKTGVFTGQCFQFCGLRHADMRFQLNVMTQSDYQAWLQDTKTAQSQPKTSLAQDGPSDLALASTVGLQLALKGGF